MSPALEERMRAAEAAFRQGELDRVATLCDEVLAVEPRNLPATVLLGMSRIQSGETDAGLQMLQSATSIDPGCFEAYLWLGIGYRDAGQLDEAIQCLKHALQIWPGHPSALSTLGSCYLQQGANQKALMAFRKAIAVRPTSAQFHEDLGNALLEMRESAQAVPPLERAAELDPTNQMTLIRLGQVYLELTRRDDAIRVFRQAYEVAPDTARGLIQLARALREEGDYAAALSALQRALALESESVDALEVISNLMQQLGRFNDAYQVVDRAIRLSPDRARLYFNRALAKKVGSESTNELASIENRLREKQLGLSDQRYLHYALAKSYNDLGELPSAMAHYDEANRVMRGLLGDREFERNIHTEEFDRKISTFTPHFFEENARIGNPSSQPVFIVGMIRSGTTLVEQILSAHRDIVGGGELLFWFQRAHEAVTRSGVVRPDSVRQLQSEYLGLLKGIDPVAQRITDKMPHNYMFLGQIHLAFPDAKIIHCRRHPVDNCLSIYMTPYQMPLDFAHDKANIVFVYREYLRLMEHWRRVLPPEQFIEVDYEHLVSDPEPGTRRMVDFLGLEWDEACLRPEDNQRAVKTPSMWQVRQPVYKTSTERWRKYEPWLGEFAELMP